MEEKRISSRKTRVGKVVSDKMDKTVVVAVADRVAHPLYKKIVGRTYKLKAHDENNTCGVGDTVKVMETRPLSKDKRWRVVEIIEKAKSLLADPQLSVNIVASRLGFSYPNHFTRFFRNATGISPSEFRQNL